jgi:DNA-binding SARP family transcriptional activator
MEFRLLGPLEVVVDDDPVALGGRRQRVILAHLILRANRVVPADLLIDELWGEQPPDTARNTLQTYVYRLRKLLGDRRIAGRGGGYVLTAAPEEIDAGRFEALVKRAKGLAAFDPEDAAATLAEALAIWRGAPLADLAGEASLQGEIARLEELRLSATERRIEAEIAAGGHSTVVSELEALTASYPLRERMWANLMLALYRQGRQAEALSTYQRAREVLSDELGAEPSAELQRLHEQILSHDASIRKQEAPPRPKVRASRVDLQPGTDFAGYQIDGVLGRGGMSVVYLAEQTTLRRKVALKVLTSQLAEDERFRGRFERESRLAASIDHPNVIPIYEAGEYEGELFIAMRYVEGTDLRTVLGGGPLDPNRTVTIIRQVADALDIAHEQGLVHRDVKPANILLVRRGDSRPGEHAYLSDFGLTKRFASDSGVTATGQFVGTIDYAAPEQFEGGQLDARTDVYSLGCVLFECLTGRAPFRAPTDAGLMYAHLQLPPPSVREERGDLPDAIDEAIATAMAKHPDGRQPTAGALAQEASRGLQPVIQDLGESTTARRRRRWLVPIVALGLVLAAATIFLVREAGDTSEPAGGRFATGDSSAGETVVPARAVAAIDPSDGKIVDAVGGMYVETLNGSVRPEIAAGAGGVWIIDGASVSVVDPRTESRHKAFGLRGTGGVGFVPSIAVRSNDVFFTDSRRTGSLHGIADGAVGHIYGLGERSQVATFPETGGATDIAFGGGKLWETFGGGVLLEVDPRTLAAVRRWNAGSSLDAVAVAPGSVWVGDRETATVWWIDPQSGERSDPMELAGAMDGIASLGGVAWVLDRSAGTVTPVATTFGAGDSIPLAGDLTDIEAGLGAVWVSDRGGSLWRIDPQTSETSQVDVGYPVESLTFDPEKPLVWLIAIECPAAGIPASETQGGLGCSR